MKTSRHLLVLLLALLLAGCGTHGVRLATDRATYTPGDTVSLTLLNGSARSLGYNLCGVTLEQQVGESDAEEWQVRPDAILTMCTLLLHTLGPGATSEAYPRELPANLTSGDYRLSTDVEAPLGSSGRRLVSPTFHVSAHTPSGQSSDTAPISLRLPLELVRVEPHEGLRIQADRTDLTVIEHTAGLVVGCRYQWVLASEDERTLLSGGLGGSCDIEDVMVSPELLASHPPGRPLRVELEVTVFETDTPPQHLWMPASGSRHRVIASRTLELAITND